MSNYGADTKPSIAASQDLAFVKSFMPVDDANVMQWTYDHGIVVRKLARRQDHSNCLFKIQE